MKPTRGPGLHSSVDLCIQTYTEPVTSKHGKLAAKCPWTYTAIFRSVYRSRRGFVGLLVRRVVGQLATTRAAAALLLVGEVLHLFPEQSLEVVLGSRSEQTHAQVGVGKQRRERPARLQCVLSSFLRPRRK